MIALISDLHSNIEAVDAVFEDMAGFDVKEVRCLGDVIGYGPDPIAVLERVRGSEFILLGNHEEGLLFYAEDFNPRARGALDWTRDQVNEADNSFEYWELIDAMQRVATTGDAMHVHASLRDETKEYVLPEDIADAEKMDGIFEKMERGVCFFGHTHIPGVWTEGRQFLRPGEIGDEYVMGSERAVINVGSVGQPRDGDNRACYVLVDGDRVSFRRVEYDYKRTMKKIVAIEELSDMLAARLKVGR